MKKGWKIFWIVIAAVTGIGVMLCCISLALGFSFSGFREAYPNGISLGRAGILGTDVDDNDFDEDYDGAEGEGYSDITQLTMGVGACDIYIKKSSDDKVYVDTRNLDFDKVKAEIIVENADGVLSIQLEKDGEIWSPALVNHDYGSLYVFLPADKELQQADLSLGAANVEIESLLVDSLDLNLGAADCTIDDLKVKNAFIKVGAGNLEMDAAVGDNLNIKCGAGNVEVELAGAKDDYNYDIESGLGNVEIDDEQLGGFASKKNIDNGSSKNISLSCGAGNASITFGD